MRKIALLLGLCVGFLPVFAEPDGRLYVTPERETFLNFPSQLLGDNYTLTVFLPQESSVAQKQYPAVYYLGLDRENKEATQEYAKQHKIFLIGINLKEQDYARLGDKLYAFFQQELIPYIELNYAVAAEPSRRILAAKGEESCKAAVGLFEQEKRFGRLALLQPQATVENLRVTQDRRVWISAAQAELAAAQSSLQAQGLSYGENFAFSYAEADGNWVSALNTDYLLAPTESVSLKQLQMKLGASSLPLENEASTSLIVYAVLKNAMRGVFIPAAVRTSPPYLEWDSALGMLRVRAGAERGTVKINITEGDLAAGAKIVLKK